MKLYFKIFSQNKLKRSVECAKEHPVLAITFDVFVLINFLQIFLNIELANANKQNFF